MSIVCINKTHKNYKALEERYGDSLAESIVTLFSKQKGLENDFEFPSISEAKQFIKNEPRPTFKKVVGALILNPNLSQRGILDFLQGVVAVNDGELFVVKGWDENLTAMNLVNPKEIFEPNLRIVQDLEERFPGIFKTVPTSKERVVKVIITPRQQFQRDIDYFQGDEALLEQEERESLIDEQYEDLDSPQDEQELNTELLQESVDAETHLDSSTETLIQNLDKTGDEIMEKQSQVLEENKNEIKEDLRNENGQLLIDFQQSPVDSPKGIKPGVEELFNENSELANIGTQAQYSQYLDTIFPDSKVKDIVYHGSNQKINQFEVRKEPLIHFGSKNAALQRGNVLNQVLLNVKDLQTIKDGMWFLGTDEGGLLKELLDRNILTIEQVKSINEAKNKAIQQSPYFNENYRMALPEGEKAGNKKLQEILKDKNIGFEYVNFSEDKGSTSYAVPSQEQIHILGNKQDIKGFREFVNKSSNVQTLKGKLDGSKLSEVEGKLEANKDRLIELLGSSMYSEKLKDVVYKELLQNAFDATKIAESKGLINKGKIDIEINEKERIISFTDNGIGMTPDIVQKAFFTIGGTYKGEDVDNKLKSGGLGLAKMAFIFGSEKLILETVSNGIKTTVDATSQEIRADNFKIKSEQTNQKNGTKVSVKIPKTYVNAKGEIRNIDFPMFIESEFEYSFLANPLIGNVDINYSIVNRESSYTKEEKLKTNLGDIPEGYILFSPAKTSFADMNIYIDTKNITKGSFFDTNHKILSSGLYQFDVGFETDDREKIPLNIIIDIKPKVDATNAQYPFNNQRENFKPTVKNDIGALNKYLALLWKSIEIELLKSSFNKIKNIDAVDVENVDNSVIAKNKEITKSFAAASNSDIIKTAIEDFNKKNKEAIINNGGLKTEQLSLTKEDIDKDAEKAYSRTFKAEKEISINKETGLNLDSNKPIIHNNTNMTLDEKSTKFLSEISSIMIEYKKSIIDFYGEDYSSNIKNQLWGVSIDKNYGGINVNPSFLNMLAINPFYNFPTNPKVDAVNYIAVALDHLIIHELNHNFERNEGASFTGRFLTTYSEIHSLPNHFELMSKLKLTIKNNLEIIKKLNYEYKQSENVESGFEGNKIEDNNQRRADIGIKSISKNDSDNNVRTTINDRGSSEKFGEIINSNILGSKQDIEGFRQFVSGQSQTQFSISPDINYGLKASNIVLNNLNKIKQWESNKSIDQNTLWKKISELGIPKQQLELLRESEGNTVEEKLTNFVANYSYSIEINTAKDFNKDGAKNYNSFDLNNRRFSRGIDDEVGQFYQYFDLEKKQFVNISQQEYEKAVNEAKIKDEKFNTQYYSNLTVPGGTNYTENEIATPAITPSIKGHAQFATDKGIGWFRSDDKYPFTGFLEDLIASGTIKKVPCG